MCIIYLVILFVLSSCSGDERLKAYYPEFEQEVSLEGTLVKKERIPFYPSALLCIDSTMLMFEVDGRIVKAYDLNNNCKEIGAYGFKGRGEEEFISCSFSGQLAKDRNTFIISDVSQGLVAHIKMTRAKDTVVFSRVKDYKGLNDRALSNVYSLKNGYYIARHFPLTLNTDKALSVLDSNLNLKSYFFAPLGEGFNNSNDFFGRLSQYENSFTYACMNFGYIAFFTISEEGAVVEKWSYLLKDMDYEKKQIDNDVRVKFRSNKNYEGFYDVKMTAKYVFASYSGHQIKDDLMWDSKPLHTILMFDHDGKPFIKFTTSHGFTYFTMSDDGRTIYTYDGEEQLVKYDLSKYLN